MAVRGSSVITVKRVVGVLALLVVAVLGYTAWQVWQVERDLNRAQSSAEDLIAATRNDDRTARNVALSEFLLSSKAADDHTDGPVWSLMTHVPVFGDDAEGVRALSRSLHTIAEDGVDPLVDVVDGLDGISSGGRVDIGRVEALQDPVATARLAFRSGYADVSGLDSSGYAGPLKARFDEYVDRIGEVSGVLGSAAKATRVLPGFLGSEGPRTYLLVFQNNAEIRSTGGLPGSWAEVRTTDGKAEIVRQGTAVEFGRRDTPVLPLSPGELGVYSDLLGVYFQDANFTPDFPRAAELMAARWEEKYATALDGVISLDPVTLSYLLEGTGPVRVADVDLTPVNVVEELLNRPYLEQSVEQQDAFFAEAARQIFGAVTTDLTSPLDVVRGLDRAATEGRFRIASFDPEEREELASTQVVGALPDDDAERPYVFVGLDDATGSKMSYYLRYRVSVEAGGCRDRRQTLSGTMTLNQTVSAAEAAGLPESVTGSGDFGTERGSQLVVVRVYGPTGGDVSGVKVDGSAVAVEPVQLNGRPVVTLAALLSGPDDVLVTWSMETGPGQLGDGRVGVTPSVTPGSKDSTFASAC